MKKKILACALTTVMAVSMIGTTAFAAEPKDWNTNGGEATVSGTNYTVDPIIEVALPGDLTFGINPLYLDADEDGTAETTQIVSTDYTIINYSNVVVNVKTDVKLENVATDIELITALAAGSFDTKSQELKAVTDKRALSIAMLVPTGAAVISAENVPSLTCTALAQDGSQVAADVKGESLSTSEVTVNYILDAFDFSDANAGKIKPANVSGFTFDGYADPNSDFVAEDVTVTAKYTLGLVSTKQKTTLWDAGKLSSTKSSGFDTTVAIAK